MYKGASHKFVKLGGRNLNTADTTTAGVMKYAAEPLHSEDSLMMESLPEETND